MASLAHPPTRLPVTLSLKSRRPRARQLLDAAIDHQSPAIDDRDRLAQMLD
jgi:hypothetical protein